MTVQLDGRLMTTREEAHLHLRQVFGFPSWYGRNLDALYDLLTEWGQPLEIQLLHRQEMEAALGNYGGLLVQTILDAARNNPRLQISQLS